MDQPLGRQGDCALGSFFITHLYLINDAYGRKSDSGPSELAVHYRDGQVADGHQDGQLSQPDDLV